MSRLILGTAQLGMFDYGINRTKQEYIDFGYPLTILHKAWELGIRQFDLSLGYGNVQQLLSVFLNGKEGYTVYYRARNSSYISTSNGSMLDFLLNDKNPPYGHSVYTPEEANWTLCNPEMGLVQVPFSVIDNRMKTYDLIDLAKQLDKEIHLRSVFLQGLLFMDPEQAAKKFHVGISGLVRHHISRVKQRSEELGLTRLEYCLGYIKACFPEHRYPKVKVIVGCDSVEQLEQIVAGWQKEYPSDLVKEGSQAELGIIDPRRWFRVGGQKISQVTDFIVEPMDG